MKNVIAVDIGNTNTVVGVFKDDGGLDPFLKFRFQTDPYATSDEIGLYVSHILSLNGVEKDSIFDGIVSSVVPQLDSVYIDFFKKYLNIEPLYVSADLDLGLEIGYKNKYEIGADRLVNAAGAFYIYKTDLIIIDFGTATTFCVVLKEGIYEGGIIAPGIKISVEALLERAAKLPKVDLVPPSKLIADNTVENIQSGFFWGFAAMIKGLTEFIQKEYNRDFFIVATGGLSTIFSKLDFLKINIEPELTLKGLKVIYQKNKRLPRNYFR